MKAIKVAVHDGIFHADDVFAIASLCLQNFLEEQILIRTKLLEQD